MFARFMAPLFFVFLVSLFPRQSPAAEERFAYATYRDLPGITQEETDAVDRILRERTNFIYGSEPSTELFLTVDGALGGYNILLCNWLSTFFGVNFTPAIYEWNDLIHGLASHDVDFTGDLTSTHERLAIYWMTSPMLDRPIKYLRIAGDKSLAEIAESRPLRYGFPAGTTTLDQVKASLEKPCEIFQVENHAAAYRMLKSYAIDVFVDEAPYEAAFDSYGDIVAEDMLPMVFGPVSLATQNPELAPIISIIQKALDSGGVKYLTRLYRRGHQEYLRHKFFSGLTEEEREYVYSHSKYGLNMPIPVGMEYDNYPIAFYNEREKAWQGCALDILEAISDISGLNFVHAFQTPTVWPEMVRMLENGEVALISELIKTTEREGRFLWPEKPFTTDNYALISRADFPNIELPDVRHHTIGLSEGTAYTELFLKWFPEHKHTKEYIDVLQPLFALERGEVDLVMSTQNQLLSMTHYMEKPYFKINISFNKKYASYFGLNKSETLLCSIISKSMRLIHVDNIAEQWKRRIFDYNSAVARERIPYLLAGMVLFLCVILLLFVMFLKRRATGKYLETLVEERTSALRHQTYRAERAAKVKSDFLARTSHEIRTPMNAIIGLSELAQREYGQPKALEYIMGIKNAGASLLAIINDILDFSKIESGNLPIHPASYETASLLNDALTVIRVRMAETPLELIVNIPPDIPGSMIGDTGRIKQILLNLLSNAVKYTNKGFIKFSVSSEPVAEDMVRLAFIVEDSGIGIKNEDLPKLFAEFTRVDEKRTINVEGTGLGLAIARSLCRAMGGDIAVQSEYGKGSVFTSTLVQGVTDWKPMGDMANITAIRAETQCVAFTAPEAEILVVDDLPSNLLVAEGLLVPYKMRVFTCLNGREAVELIRERSFDLVLMDHMMPEMDGVEATQAIRAMNEERCRTMPVIALTANAVSGMREMFLENGFNDFLSKPIETAKLDAVLKKWIPESKRRKAPEKDEKVPTPVVLPETVLPEIAGVDMVAGLARIGGSQSRYLDLLAMFCRDAAAGFSLLEKEPDAASLRSFTTLVHSLKSALANIGANGLSQTAALLEKAGREADLSMIRDKLPLFHEELSVLTERIREVTAAAQVEGVETQANPEIEEALARLREALEMKDVDAMDSALARLRSFPSTGKTREIISELTDLLLKAEFGKATDLIASLFSEAQP
jgi:signal transduction histidine kinase/HPt (histidine-containing phosphotransfer) domain-containing protein/FixJ family two-component response regulator